MTRETYFLYRKPQKLKFVKIFFENCLRKVSLHAVSCIVPKMQKWAAIAETIKKVLALKMD